jgi:UDP-N-acetyl-D-galactosamine dehydrogenase
MKESNNLKLGIIGLGYVGLPLLIAFSKFRKVYGYDLNQNRIKDLNNCLDYSNEVKKKEFNNLKNIYFTNKINELKNCNFYIICVPTPIYSNKNPDLSLLKLACSQVASIIKDKDIVVFESTVYPGTTEEICIPIIEKISNIQCIQNSNKNMINKGFYCGYSPERINPGDKKHTISNIKKVISSSSKHSIKIINSLYLEIVKAGTYIADSIKVAEAAKIIENTQRDLNIALFNELSIIFDKLKINTHSVIKAASTKWNFIKYYPGLVGGHCIGVDPYYLTYKARMLGYNPKLILAGRSINDKMGKIIAGKILSKIKEKKIVKKKIKVLILGLTFKENCSDIRNSKVFDIVDILQKKKYFLVHVYDPLVSKKAFVNVNKKFLLIKNLKKDYYDIIILAVAHKIFIKYGPKKIKACGKKNSIFFDVKSCFDEIYSDLRL